MSHNADSSAVDDVQIFAFFEAAVEVRFQNKTVTFGPGRRQITKSQMEAFKKKFGDKVRNITPKRVVAEVSFACRNWRHFAG